MAAPHKIIPIRAIAGAPGGSDALYEVQKKIYPRAVTGWFATWRWTLVAVTQVIFYGLPWLAWNGRQAVLFDLAERKFYLLGLVFWPQDFIYLTLLLLISALSLFLFTAVAGRLWCGFACPQTVYTEIFLWIERVAEGDRAARMRLDAGPWTANKALRKSVKQGAWVALSLWTGFTFVGYFTPIATLAREVATFTLGPWETFWLLFYGLATYGNAGFLREQVCKYMCPYARFQGVMFDRDTLVITYDAARGEARGGRARSADRAALGLGDCVDCSLCVQVCPTGIDIREGLQYECIGCGACIDACNQVMDRMAYPRGLIRYASLNALADKLDWPGMARRVLRPRVLLYTVVTWTIIVAAGWHIATRAPLKVDVLRDRNALSRELSSGEVENVYRLQLMNTAEAPLAVTLAATGVPGLAVAGPATRTLAPLTTELVAVSLRAPGEVLSPGSHPIQFHISHVHAAAKPGESTPEQGVVHEKSAFFKSR